MIKQFHIQNYKALRDVTLDLTPIHVLIGPNDTGKTSILDAITALCRSVDHDLAAAFLGPWEGKSLVWHGEPNLSISLAANIGNCDQSFEYSITCGFVAAGRQPVLENERFTFLPESRSMDFEKRNTSRTQVYAIATGGGGPDDQEIAARRVHDALAGLHSYRWEPRLLALPVAAGAVRPFHIETSGFGLALCLDDIIWDERDCFNAMEQRFRTTFPQIKSIVLKREPGYQLTVKLSDSRVVSVTQGGEGKGIYFRFVNGGKDIAASQISDGILLVLAYLTVLYLPQPPRVLLVEEPENGIHPKRLKEVLTILRELVGEQSHTQVILTTHSPYVLDLFEAHEVTLCHRKKDGSIGVCKLSDSKTVREQLDVFTLGEIWTAEGDEAIANSSTSGEEAAP